MKTPLRWHCTVCKRDVKITAIIMDADSVQPCPLCRNNSAVFLQFTPRPRRISIESQRAPFLKPQTT